LSDKKSTKKKTKQKLEEEGKKDIAKTHDMIFFTAFILCCNFCLLLIIIQQETLVHKTCRNTQLFTSIRGSVL
jgi:hypothetical protein